MCHDPKMSSPDPELKGSDDAAASTHRDLTAVAAVSDEARWQRWTWLSLAAFLAAAPHSIAIAQVFLAAAALCWLRPAFAARRLSPLYHRALVPLIFFTAFTAISALVSQEPATGLRALKKCLLFLIIPGVSCAVVSERQAIALCRLLLVSGALAGAIGIYQFFAALPNPAGRITGLYGHWMAYSDVLMLLFIAGAFMFAVRRWSAGRLLLIGMPLAAALVLSMSRSAWVGTLFGLAVLAGLLRSRRTLVPALGAAAALLLAPLPQVRQRVDSIFDLQSLSHSFRIEMALTGIRIAADHPLTGVGPGQIPAVYRQYTPDTLGSEKYFVHLHNNFVQIAAERGIPTLFAFIWFLAVVAKDLWNFLRSANPVQRDLAVLAISVLVSFLVFGLFEYNFGDSEPLMLLLFLISLPYSLQNRQLS